MKQLLTIDKAGRVVIPKPVRELLRLDAGDELVLTADDGTITLTPRRQVAPLVREMGVWVDKLKPRWMHLAQSSSTQR